MSNRCRAAMSHSEIAKALGCSRQLIQQIERKAMFKLRLAMGSWCKAPVSEFLRESCGVPEPEGYQDPVPLIRNHDRAGRFAKGDVRKVEQDLVLDYEPTAIGVGAE